MKRLTLRKIWPRNKKPTMRGIEKFFFSDIQDAGKRTDFSSVVASEGDIILKHGRKLKKRN
ncbi:MAG: hypothetical protein HYW05_01030 [Candidatus Diapherotrites archaeon]|nr:hypothetical protein [Candidatus Diapherotrites archaeon]